jgi:hypothetical protein
MRTEVKALTMTPGILLMAMLAMAVCAFGQVETIDATARGTSTQLGAIGNIRIIINQFSTPEDRATLKQAFVSGGQKGLTDALSKMKSAGRIQIPGTVGYDLAFAQSIPTPTGRKIRFATNRRIAFKEAYRNTRSQAYNLTAGEINIDDQDKNKSAGVLYPAAQLIINNDGELQLELLQNPWQLVNIIDWNGKAKD